MCAVAALASLGGLSSARADVAVIVDLGSQTMNVYVNGYHEHAWPVSSGARGHATPAGNYRVRRMERVWYSTIYDNAPMPHAIFFRGGYAIHGTNHVGRLGRPASHGCIRLAPSHAARLYSLVANHGPARTRIRITY
ncbi:MAG: L,D-transpeptidase [Hyphomicrobium sp.]